MGSVVYMPADDCPQCGVSVFDGPVNVLESRVGRKGCVTRYQCGCGFVFERYWPKVGTLLRLARDGG